MKQLLHRLARITRKTARNAIPWMAPLGGLLHLVAEIVSLAGH